MRAVAAHREHRGRVLRRSTTRSLGPYEIEHTDDEWRRLLAPDAYRILRRRGTEPAFGNALWDNHAEGTYLCGGCGWPLFDSADKYDSGSGWPSFKRPIEPQAVETATDTQFGMTRTEVRCTRCGSHLGHLFDDGPAPYGTRYCMNSGSLRRQPRNRVSLPEVGMLEEEGASYAEPEAGSPGRSL